MLSNPYVKLLVLAGGLYALHKYGTPAMKIAAVAIGAGVAVNQLAFTRDLVAVKVA